MNATTPSALAALSNDLAAAVERIASSIVYVDASARRDASGVALDEHTVVTVDHVLDRDEDIELILAGDARCSAEVIGRDPTTDLALLRTSASLAPAARADLADIKIGHIVLAVARDEDGASGASLGVVSALDGSWRTWRGGEIDRFLRPDLSMYPGFSGGPLVDAAGAVLGINTWGLSRRTALTIPMSTVDRVVAQLRGGGIRQGYLGVALQVVRIPEKLRAEHGIGSESAAIVVDVATGGPADRAGVVMGDVILALGEHAIEDADDLQRALAGDSVGAVRSLRILRAGTPRDLAVTVAERRRDDD
jgi:S1-C subfamily serine protease